MCLITVVVGEETAFSVQRFKTRFGALRALKKEYDKYSLMLDCDGYAPVAEGSLRAGHVAIRTRSPRGEDGEAKTIEAVLISVVPTY